MKKDLHTTKYSGVVVEEAGTETMAGKTATVTFVTPQIDTNYFINLSWNGDYNFFWTSPQTTQFTLNCSYTSQTATVHWTISR